MFYFESIKLKLTIIIIIISECLDYIYLNVDLKTHIYNSNLLKIFMLQDMSNMYTAVKSRYETFN